ncbi:DUF4870 domain-containing protein [soil metagenome]
MTSPNAPTDPKPNLRSGPLDEAEKRTAMWCHLSSMAGLLVPGANILAPLCCWLTKKDSSPFVNFHGKESLNFQINMLLYSLIACPFCCAGVGVVPFTGWDETGQSLTWGGLALGIGLIVIITLFEIVVSIMAGIKAYEGVWHRYPFLVIRFFK